MDLRARVERLERCNRRLKATLLIGGLLLITAVAMGPAQPQLPAELRAAKFVVVDQQGNPRGELGMLDDGPGLRLLNREGKPVAQVQVSKIPDKPALYFLDEGGRQQLELALTVGGPVLHFKDGSGTRVRVATNELNAPLVAVYSDKGEPLFRVSADKSADK